MLACNGSFSDVSRKGLITAVFRDCGRNLRVEKEMTI